LTFQDDTKDDGLTLLEGEPGGHLERAQVISGGLSLNSISATS